MRWMRPAGAAAAVGLLAVAGLLYFNVTLPDDPRDRGLALDRPAARPLEIVTVGTSLTDRYAWPDELADCLPFEVVVTRVARSGASSDWGVQQVGAVAGLAPDLVIIEFSVNDADIRRRVSRARSADNHRRLIAGIRAEAPEARILLMTMSPAAGLRRLLRPRLPAYYALYRDLAETLDTGLLDLYPRWLALPRRQHDLPDGLHPTEKAASEIILPALIAHLGAHLGAPSQQPCTTEAEGG